MLDGFQYVLAQIAVVVAITALLAGVLGWLIGHGSRRRTEKAFKQAVAAIARPEPGASPFAPTPTIADAGADSETPPAEAAADPDVDEDAAAPPLAQRQPYGAALIEHVPLHDTVDPEATIIRPASNPKTTPYLPPSAVISSTPIAPSAAVHRPRTNAQTPTSEDVQQLRQELRDRDLELGRIEAGALSAWDRMVPHLEQQIEGLTQENDALRRRIREAEEHSGADSLTVDHLRALVADRDARIAELRAQA
jgi:hypothetical protein